MNGLYSLTGGTIPDVVWAVPASAFPDNVQAQPRPWHSAGTLPKCNMNKATCSTWKESLAVWLQAVECHLLLELDNWLWSILFTDKDVAKLIYAESA